MADKSKNDWVARAKRALRFMKEGIGHEMWILDNMDRHQSTLGDNYDTYTDNVPEKERLTMTAIRKILMKPDKITCDEFLKSMQDLFDQRLKNFSKSTIPYDSLQKCYNFWEENVKAPLQPFCKYPSFKPSNESPTAFRRSARLESSTPTRNRSSRIRSSSRSERSSSRKHKKEKKREKRRKKKDRTSKKKRSRSSDDDDENEQPEDNDEQEEPADDNDDDERLEAAASLGEDEESGEGESEEGERGAQADSDDETPIAREVSKKRRTSTAASDSKGHKRSRKESKQEEASEGAEENEKLEEIKESAEEDLGDEAMEEETKDDSLKGDDEADEAESQKDEKEDSDNKDNNSNEGDKMDSEAMSPEQDGTAADSSEAQEEVQGDDGNQPEQV
eukprot:Filipodium_phascolosomae@DN2171_c0_g1_i1.p1